ncbi:sugar phosphate isomerase/epimerase family protein [Paenibacillus sp. LHD-117]|uniref:sugar phosphate isomerase/epimerase family protein n=1 Tax=Paenibacillus sp. LHD-117 TaxID=3071412 RepID=UPI0027DF2B8F|nr:sugar phosphate isomerase/epimerase family protein [Paenibacillus sp. LHD-117]MDQ6420287.1 sugar phosphate isomerase/epimerase family protein [Paenibacillus sp. LHD-117]
MKFGVFTVMMPDCTTERTLTLLKEYGYDGVEWRFTRNDPSRSTEAPSFWGNNLSTVDASASVEELSALRARTDALGLETPNLAAYIQSGDLEATERAMKAAKLLGAPSIRVGVPMYDRSRPYGDLFKEARDYLGEVEEMSRSIGVKGLIEVHHGNIACSATLARRLVDGFDASRIGVIYDPGNMVHEGFEQYRMGLEALGEYLGHVHVKNASWARTAAAVPSGGYGDHEKLWQASWCALSEGVVHWPQMLADLKAIGYNSWLSFEDFSGSAPTETLLRENLAYIKSLL